MTARSRTTRPIAWVSPLPPTRTDIASYTARLFQQEQPGDITLVYPDDLPCELALQVRIEPLSRLHSLIVDEGHIPFYHVGNNAIFHSAILEAAQVYPGVVVAHDIQIQHLILGMHRSKGDWFDIYRTIMGLHYGEDGEEAALSIATGYRSHDDLASKFPLIEEACINALAVIVHNDTVTERLAKRTGLPVVYLPLPYPAPPSPASSRKQRPRPDGRMKLLVFGYMGTNRGLNDILAAMAANPRLHLDVMGQIDPDIDLQSMAKRHGVLGRVAMLGYVPEPELDRAIAEADLVVNLRNPTVGEASGSQLRIWANLGTGIVSNHGWYSSLPDETVFKADPDAPVKGILDAVAAIEKDPDLGVRIGLAGSQYLRSVHDPQLYIQQIKVIAQNADAASRYWFAYSLARRNADYLPQGADPLNDRLPALVASVTGIG